MTPHELTEAQAQALLAYHRIVYVDPDPSDEDLETCARLGWVHIDMSETRGDGGMCWSVSGGDEPDKLLARAQIIANCLTPRQFAGLIALDVHPRGDAIMAGSAAIDLVHRGLATATPSGPADGEHDGTIHITDFGRLCLVLFCKRPEAP